MGDSEKHLDEASEKHGEDRRTEEAGDRVLNGGGRCGLIHQLLQPLPAPPASPAPPSSCG